MGGGRKEEDLVYEAMRWVSERVGGAGAGAGVDKLRQKSNEDRSSFAEVPGAHPRSQVARSECPGTWRTDASLQYEPGGPGGLRRRAFAAAGARCWL